MKRWGFIAAGLMARMMADDMKYVEDAVISAVTSRTEQSAETFAKDYKVSRIHSSVEELVNDPEVDIVYVTSPHNLHYLHARMALEAGKPVLVEKPFTINAKQAIELVRLAREKQLFLMEAMWIRYLPIITTLRRVLEDGVIGQIRLFRAAFHQHLDFGPEHRVYNPALAGGSLLDLGIYPISLASMVYKRQPLDIASLLYLGETGVDEHFAAVFHYDGREMGLVSAGADGLHPQDVELFGLEGEVCLQGHQIWKYDRMITKLHDGKEETFYEPFDGGGYNFQADEVHRCLEGGLLESEVMPLDETVHIMETLDRMRRAWGLQYPDER